MQGDPGSHFASLYDSSFVDACVKALLGLTQIESVRPYLTLPLPLAVLKQSGGDDEVKKEGISSHTVDSDMMKIEKLNNKKEKDEMKREKEMKNKEEGGKEVKTGNPEGPLTAVHVILQLVKSRPSSAVNCIGLLMNACLDSSLNKTAAPSSCCSSPSSSSSSSSSSASSSSSSTSSSSHTVPSTVTVRCAVAAAGGAALGLTGVHMTPHNRAHFFSFEAPEGNSWQSYGQTFISFI